MSDVSRFKREGSCLIYEGKEGGKSEGVNIGQEDCRLLRQLGKELPENVAFDHFQLFQYVQYFQT